QISSIFVDLDVTYTTIPIERRGQGGGLTSFGDEIVLVTHDGRIYSIQDVQDTVKTKIQPPDNGFDAYQEAASSPQYRDLAHDFGWFRFNDILAFEMDGQRELALSYTFFDADQSCYANRIATLEIPAQVERLADFEAQPDDWQVVLTTEPCLPMKRSCLAIDGHMAGGRMAFARPSTVYLASSDYKWDGMCTAEAIAQHPTKQYGKVLAIDLKTKQPRIVSRGHRNMQGIVVDRHGDVWVAEHGMRGGDELNLIVDGANYGWPLESLGTDYNKLPIKTAISYGRHENYEAPVFAWLPSPAVSNLIEIDGFDPAWDGDLVVGGLRSESLQHVRVREGRVLFSEQIPVGVRVRYVHQHTDGRLIIWTDQNRLLFLTPSRLTPGRDRAEEAIAAIQGDPATKAEVRNLLDRCNECHSLEPDDHVNAPSLAQIFDAPVAATSYAGYSSALQRLGGRWSRERLSAYLANPAAFAPGTSMPGVGRQDPETVDRLIDVLENSADAFGEPS
ncbi:MAG: PQQ-dependent sugar dehydrogenase, partial [Planctomycetes bacterium]|nr:PQQ-dependent sugar dehydrogenase [Planctomycetota bacterium]